MVAAAWLVLGLAAPAIGRAEAVGGDAGRGFFRCDTRHASAREFLRSDASIDVYNGLTWLGGAGAISFLSDPSRRWTHVNGFDSGIQDGLRLDSSQARQDADSASDFALAFNVAVLPAAAIGASFARRHDCIETWEMFGNAVESVSLALFVAEGIKQITGRERPFGDRCRRDPPHDANCHDGDDRHSSFVSGHATLAAAGAGVTCRFALARDAFGASPAARAGPCALGVATALVAGTLRVASDRHWGTDVLVGFGLGALIGSFDTWGPFDWLRIERRDAKGEISARGGVLPWASDGRFGARLALVY